MTPKRGFAKIIVAVVIVILIGLAGYFVISRKGSAPVVQQTPTLTPKLQDEPDETVKWKTYRNEKYGFEFKHPSNYKIVADFVKVEYPSGRVWYRVDLEDKQSIGEPWIRFELNPDGYGPIFNSKRYDLSLERGNIIVDRVVIVEKNEYNQGPGEMITTRGLEYPNGQWVSWMFSFNKDNVDYEPVFKKILSTFKFIEPATNISTWKTYINTEYGFQLTFTDAWVGYKVYKEQLINNSGASYIFAVPTQDKTFSDIGVPAGYFRAFILFVLDKNTIRPWDESGPHPKYLKSSQTVDFYVSYPQEIPDDLESKIRAEQVVNTLKLLP